MSCHSFNSRPVDERRPLRLGALAMAALMLLTACATGAPSGGGMTAYRYSQPISEDSPEAWTLEAEAEEEDTGDGEAIFFNLPTDFRPVRVSDPELTTALTAFWLQVQLRVSTSCPPLYAGRKLALASAPLSGEAWQSDLAQSYGRFCERRGTPGDCLTLFGDGPRLQDNDKRSMALALAVGPALEGVDAEVRLRAYAQLYEDAPRASTFAELREVGDRFGRVIGPNSVRILVMVATAAIGETAALMSKGLKLPGFGQASHTVEANTGLRLMDAATGAERVIVSVNEGTIRMVLPVNAVSMTARNGGGANPRLKPNVAAKDGKLLPGGHRAFGSFRAFKQTMARRSII